MDSESLLPSGDVVKCSNCGCTCDLGGGSPNSWIRSVKRKQVSEDANQFHVPGLESDVFSNARVQIENECDLLREAVGSQQQAIQDLYVELDEERNASSTAANEAMSMILRLQREKAEIEMEARQFKCFAEEKMAHDQQVLAVVEDSLYKREQAIQSLTCEVQAYKHKMLSYGLTEIDFEVEKSRFSRSPSMVDTDTQFDLPVYDYPPLKCTVNENPDPLEEDIVVEDLQNYPLSDSPYRRERLKTLENKLSQMEKIPSYNTRLDGNSTGGRTVVEKVVVGHPPRRPRHFKSFSTDSSNSPFGTAKEIRPNIFIDSHRCNNDSFEKLIKKDEASEVRDDMSDRVYTIDSVHNEVPHHGVAEGKPGVDIIGHYASCPRELLSQPGVGEPDIKKLYLRLQALEADRESMRETILSMRTDKAQLVLLKEIAQQLSKEARPERRMPVSRSFSFFSIFKWIFCSVLWKRKARQSKDMHGIAAKNTGLLMVLDKSLRRQWRCLTSIQV